MILFVWSRGLGCLEDGVNVFCVCMHYVGGYISVFRVCVCGYVYAHV